MVNDKTLNIIEALYPDFREYADNAIFFHWMDYACELDEITNVAYIEEEKLIEYLNKRMTTLRSGSAQHDACVDVASTLDESVPSYKGVFKYE